MSGLEASIKTIASRVNDHASTIATEEAAKTSVVLPFFQALGYDVFNPAEVVPEFTADTPGKKGEKVDYAIRIGDEIQILVECKGLTVRLEKRHLGQLYRYFSVENAKFAILTNGRFYEFYTDLEQSNRLDEKPFFKFDILNFSAAELRELEKFQRSAFDVDAILKNAERLKIISLVKNLLLNEMEEPSQELVRFIAGRVHEGRVTASVRGLVSSATRRAFKEIVSDQMKARISDALQSSDTEEIAAVSSNEIETTQDEIEGMLTIRAAVRGVIDADRVNLRDAKSYCAILIDDNNRKPLARLHFNTNQKYIGLFDSDKEERIPIRNLTEILEYVDRLCATASKYA